MKSIHGENTMQKKSYAQAGFIIFLVMAGWLGIAAPALAHHVMGGRLPGNFFEGLLSGFGHPIIGLDHFAFVIAVGLLSINQPGKYWIPGAFVLATVAGTVIHLFSFDLPVAEIAIALSLIAAGMLLLARYKLPASTLSGLAALAGLFHGYAYGESIVGAEATPLLAYLAGFSIIQYAIALLALGLGSVALQKIHSIRPVTAMRCSGTVIAAIGVVFLYAQMV
jgi:urease accessory protein